VIGREGQDDGTPHLGQLSGDEEKLYQTGRIEDTPVKVRRTTAKGSVLEGLDVVSRKRFKSKGEKGVRDHPSKAAREKGGRGWQSGPLWSKTRLHLMRVRVKY